MSECGEIGRRAGFRFQWGNPWEFESPHSHHINDVDIPRVTGSAFESAGPRDEGVSFDTALTPVVTVVIGPRLRFSCYFRICPR